jgi:hypothetical protein
MAIEYFLLIRDGKHRIEQDEIRAALVSNFSTYKSASSGMLLGKGLSISLSEEDSERAAEDGALYPGVTLVFRIDKFNDHEAGMMGMLKVVRWFLESLSCDIELSFQLEDIVLSRREGRLLLGADESFWSFERRSIFKRLLGSTVN